MAGARVHCDLIFLFIAVETFAKHVDLGLRRAVIDAPDVYRTHFMLGAWKFYLKRKREAEQHYQRAMGMYDRDPYVYYSLGQEYLNARMYRSAEPLFRKVLEIDSTIVEARARLAMVLAEQDEWAEGQIGDEPLRHPVREV